MSTTSVTSNEPSSNMDQKFPTAGLKSLLQNSDLLEILLRPLSKTPEVLRLDLSPSPSPPQPQSQSPPVVQLSSPINNSNSIDLFTDLTDLPDLLEPKPNKITPPPATSSSKESSGFLELLASKSTSSDGETSGAKIYGNPFLGPNLWDKNDLFQGGMQFEHLEIDEFLNQNGLSETDVQFLDQIQKLDPVSSLLSTSEPLPINNATAASSVVTEPSKPIRSNEEPVKESIIKAKSSQTERPKTRYQSKKPTVSASTSSCDQSEEIRLQNRKRQRPNEIDNSLDLSTSSTLNDNSDEDSSDNDSDVDLDSDQLASTQTGTTVVRKSKKFVPNELKDEKYWNRRRKNNLAAKRSRDARRMKENQIAIRASYLERENDLLRKQLDEFRRESKALKQKVAKYESIYPDLVEIGK